MAKLNPKQEQFCQEYIIDSNITQAAIRAGYSERSASSNAVRMMAYDGVKSRIAELQQARSEEKKSLMDEAVEQLTGIAFHKLDLNDMKWSDKMKAFELLCKYLGMLDGSGARKPTEEGKQGRLLEIITRIGIGGSRDPEPSDKGPM